MFKHASEISQAELIERWENAERVLVNMPEHERKEHWCMSAWGTQTPCGTIACAAGHCGMDPWFIERGFELVPLSQVKGSRHSVGYLFRDDRENEISDRPVTEFFGYDGTRRIFYNPSPRSVDCVIAEVRRHIQRLRKRHRA